MKIQIASDLHLSSLEKKFPGYRIIAPADADVLVLAGDIHRAARAIDVFGDWPVPVVYVHGNHELYDARYPDVIGEMHRAAAGTNVHLLEQGEFMAMGVRFLGCCLWTDYALDPAGRQGAMAMAGQRMRDHTAIRTSHGLFTPEDALENHLQSRAWLESRLSERFDGPTVVVTHHGPHPQSVHPRYAGMLLNAAFVSDLTGLVAKADLWIHGHVHDSFDYTVEGTRVVANPRGYPLNRLAVESVEQIDWENKQFDPALVVEI